MYFSPLVGRGPVEQLMDPFVISCVGWMQGASPSVVTITHYEARKGVTVGAPRPCQVYRRMSGEVRLAAAVLVTTPLVTPRSTQCAPWWPSVTRLHQQLVITCDIATRASNEPSRRLKFYNRSEGPYYSAFFWLKAPISAFTV